MQILIVCLLALIIACAVAASLARDLMATVVIFMCQSLALCIVWMTLQSPDLAITEAAVGAGVSSILMFAALKKIHAIGEKGEAEDAEETEE